MNDRPVSPGIEDNIDEPEDRSIGYISHAATTDPDEAARRRNIGRYCARRCGEIADFILEKAQDLPSGPQRDHLLEQHDHYRFLQGTVNCTHYHGPLEHHETSPINRFWNRGYEFDLSEFKHLLPHLI